MIDKQNTTRHDPGKSPQQIGPATAALRAMPEDTPEQRELRALREALEAHIAAGIEILDQLDAGELRS